MGQTNYGNIDETRKDAGGARNSKWLSCVCPKEDMADGGSKWDLCVWKWLLVARLCSGVSRVLKC